MISNSSYFTACAPIFSADASAPAIPAALTFRSETIGSRTLCAASPSGPRTLASSSATSSVRKSLSALLLAADRNAVAQGKQNRVKTFRGIYQAVKLLHAQRGKEIGRAHV